MIPLNVMNKYLKEKLNQRFPPRIDAVERRESDTHPEIAARNQVVREVETQGAKIWKQTSGYHHRSLAETAMYRIPYLLRSAPLLRMEIILKLAFLKAKQWNILFVVLF